MRNRLLGLAALAALVLGAPGAAEVRGVVEVVGDKPIVLAVAPAFGESALAARVTKLLSGALDRAHWFERLAFDGSLEEPGEVPAALVPAGAAFVVSAALMQAEAGAAELRGYLHAADGTRQLGRVYRVDPAMLAVAVHRFADDLVEELTGEKGIAGSTIAYVADHQGRPAIHTTAPDGSRDQKLVSGRFECLFPRYAPGKEWLVYTAFPRGFPELMLFDIPAGKNTSLSARAGMNSLAAVSPDGTRIAATLSYEGNPELYLLDLAGKVVKRLTRNRANDLSPSWSPDGSQLAFVSDRAGAPAVYLMASDGSGEPRRITHPFDSSSYCVNPAFSPKGDYLAFSARIGGRFDVMVHRVADGQFFKVTEGGPDEESLDWAPDNRHLVVSTKKGGASGLDVIDVRRPSNRFTIPLTGRTGVRDPTWCKVVY